MLKKNFDKHCCILYLACAVSDFYIPFEELVIIIRNFIIKNIFLFLKFIIE